MRKRLYKEAQFVFHVWCTGRLLVDWWDIMGREELRFRGKH
jgi:hypothetical protein